MPGARVVELGEGRRMVDLDFRDTEGLVAAFLLPEPEGWALVETGPTTCHEALLRGLSEAGVEPAEVRDVLVTHIHLDHAGGVGALAAALPNATFHAHELGVGHLADPQRLIAGARRAWGPASDQLWGTVVATPAARLHALRGGERLPLRGGDLEVVPTPGHAKHHLAFVDHRLGALFAGDGAGVLLEGSERIRPAIPPPDLDLEQLFASLERMRDARPRTILLSHFGPTPHGTADLTRYRSTVERWRDVALRAALERPDAATIARALEAADVPDAGSTPGGKESLVSGYELAAQGLLRYFQTHRLLPGTPA